MVGFWFQFFLTMFTLINWQDEVEEIEIKIEQLEQLQSRYRSRAKVNANNAMRWQFQSENYQDARRAWEKAASDKQKVQEIQDQINDLTMRKQEILKEHGQVPS